MGLGPAWTKWRTGLAGRAFDEVEGSMSCQSVVVSAPGKIILHGEHAVVYGKTAVAMAIGLRTTVKLEECCNNQVTLKLLDLNVECSWDVEELGQKLPCVNGNLRNPTAPSTEEMAAFLEVVTQCDGVQKSEAAKDASQVFIFLVSRILNDKRLFPLTVEVTSSLPVGAGLGSSAAYSVGLVTALLLAKGVINIPTVQQESCKHRGTAIIPGPGDLNLICSWSFEAEKLIHGKPSGIDNSISTHGGALSFKDRNIKHLKSIPTLKSLLVHSKVPRSTRAMVAAVREKYQQFPRIYDALFEAIGAISEESCESLELLEHLQEKPQVAGQEIKDCYTRMEKLIDLNQQLLCMLGVSHPSLDKICDVTTARGLHSKMTGAGGGGCALTLISEGTSDKLGKGLRDELSSLGFEVWETTLGAPGVTVHDCR